MMNAEQRQVAAYNERQTNSRNATNGWLYGHQIATRTGIIHHRHHLFVQHSKI